MNKCSCLILLIAAVSAIHGLDDESDTSQDEVDIDEKVEKDGVCYTEECLQVAKAFRNAMNESADPCHDFHEYACGKWSPDDTISNYIHESVWSALDSFSYLALWRLEDALKIDPTPDDIVPVQQMKKLYESCKDNETRESEGLQPLLSKFQETNGFPMIMSHDEWNAAAMTWQEIDHYYENLLGLNAFYSLTVTESPSGRNELVIAGPKLISHEGIDDDFYFYEHLSTELLELLIEENGTNVTVEDLENDIYGMLSFKNELHQAWEKMTDDLFFENTNEFIEWWSHDLKSRSSKSRIDWNVIFGRLLAIADLSSNDASIILQDELYFKRLNKLLHLTDNRILVNFVHWKFLTHMGEFSTTRMTNIMTQVTEFDVSRKYRPSWLSCLPDGEPAAIHLFGKIYYGHDTRIAVDTMIKNIKEAFVMQAKASNWLSLKVKMAIDKKLAQMTYIQGYPEWYDDATAITEFYKDVKIGNSYFENMLSLKKNAWINTIKLWGKSEIRELVSGVMDANAIYRPADNQLYVPVANFQPPLFDGTLPQYVGYATVGFTFGHEISHMIDINAIRFRNKRKYSLITDDMIDCFIRRVECLVKLYDNLSKGTGYTTLDENLADYFGIKAALQAYRTVRSKKHPNGELKLPGFETFSDEKMFFLSYAEQWCSVSDEGSSEKDKLHSSEKDKLHSSEKDRIVGLLSINSAFVEAFDCPKKCAMNQEYKCDIWTVSEHRPGAKFEATRSG